MNLIKTSDGSHTIYVPELNENYHSVHGAVQESAVVFVQNGYMASPANPVRIFEVGFGTGLNALLTLCCSEKDRRKVFYTSIEKYPIDASTVAQLNHSEYAGVDGKRLFDAIHKARWGQWEELTGSFALYLVMDDLLTFTPEGNYDLIYYDAFAPDKQPSMWSEEILAKVAGTLAPGGIFVTYSSKGDVKRSLRKCGLSVSLLPGPPGKREMIRAILPR